MMQIFLSASSRIRADLCKESGFGLVYSPVYPQRIREDIPHIVDNGAWSAHVKGEDWNEEVFYRFLDRVKNPYFVVIPDIVAGGKASLRRSLDHVDRISFPRYLAVQNGINAGDTLKFLPYIDGYFVGGDMVWKMRTAHYWVEFAHRHGKLCHIGRVGTRKKYEWAWCVGADSVDGSTPVRHDFIHKIPDWIREIETTPRLEVIA